MSTVAATVAVGGACVLGSYGYMSKHYDDALWGGLKATPRLFTYWSVSAGLTALSFLYVMYFLAFGNEVHESWGFSYDVSLLVILVVFLVCATLWAPLTIAARHNPDAIAGVTGVLWGTAVSAIALFILVVGTEQSIQSQIAVIAASLVAYHHVIWDAQVWRETWRP